MGPAIVLDFRHKGINEAISLAEIQAAGDIQVGDRVLTMTGRHTQYRTPQSHDRPYITEEAVRWLVEDRKINCLGTDSSGFEVRGVSHHPDHRLLNNAGIPVLECLNNLVELRQQRVFLIALPWPVIGLDACPVRAIAIEPEA
jgi:kynurenine formamidase